MNKGLNPKLSNVSENLGVLLDKAICEENFRWQLITEPDKILEQYEITDENDIKVVHNMIEQMKRFITNRVQTLGGKTCIDNYKKSNSNLTYSDAMDYKKTHNC